MRAKEFLKQLNPHSAVFEENIKYDYTEKQLILFAELYHKHQAKNNEVLDIVSYTLPTTNELNKELDEYKNNEGEIALSHWINVYEFLLKQVIKTKD